MSGAISTKATFKELYFFIVSKPRGFSHLKKIKKTTATLVKLYRKRR